jgi:hypothetical protein
MDTSTCIITSIYFHHKWYQKVKKQDKLAYLCTRNVKAFKHIINHHNSITHCINYMYVNWMENNTNCNILLM